MSRITISGARSLATAAGIRPEEKDLEFLARALETMVTAIERCESLDLPQHEPAVALRLSGGAADAEL